MSLDASIATPEAPGPSGFAWLPPGRLAAPLWPGIVADLGGDLEALRRVGVTVLIAADRLNEEDLGRHGMRSCWYLISDTHAPSVQRIYEHMDRLLAGHDIVAVHCHAGVAGTGTVLVAYLIWRGRSAPAALEKVRRGQPGSVQGTAKKGFLKEFADALSRRDKVSASAKEP
jgi:atypical dual specificity phosphatase